MRKKLITAILFFMLIISATQINIYALPIESIKPIDFDGAFKAYFNNPISAAAGETDDGVFTVVVGDLNPSRLVIYTEKDGEKNINYTDTESYPSKLLLYGNYLFVLENINIKIYYIQNGNLSYITSFNEHSHIRDFSIADNILYLLTNTTVYKYEIIIEEDIQLSLLNSREFAGMHKITAIDANSFILIAANSINRAYMTGSLTEIISNINVSFCFYSQGVLYYHRANAIYAYDIENGTEKVYNITISDNPSSGEIKYVSNMYVFEDKLYITDEVLKKVISLNTSDLSFSGFCLSSFSYDEGRFNMPSHVSIFSGGITVCAKNRIQIFDDQNILSNVIYLNVNPKYCFIDATNNIYYSDGIKIYKADYSDEITQNDFEELSYDGVGALRDFKISTDGKIYILTDIALYIYNSNNELLQVITIFGGKKISVNVKTQDIYILTEDKILIINKNYQNLVNIDITDSFSFIETDFDGNIYLYKESFTNGQAVVTRLSGKDYSDATEYAFTGIADGNISMAATEPLNGTVYFTSNNLHAVFTINKDDMQIAVAGDIPFIPLESNPQNTDFIADCKTLIINGYPSTMFYPFNQNTISEDYFPAGIAFTGDIINIDSGTEVLSIYETEHHYAVFYNKKLGFILKDNTTIINQPDIEDYQGELIFAADLYNLPYFIKGSQGSLFVKARLEKWSKLTVLSSITYKESSIVWLFVEHQGNFGYISSAAVIQHQDKPEMPYIKGRVNSDTVIFDKPNGELMHITTDNNEIKIFYYRDDYAYISISDVSGNEIKGYILKSSIIVDTSFEKRRAGFLILLGTIGLSVIFAFIKRKFFY